IDQRPGCRRHERSAGIPCKRQRTHLWPGIAYVRDGDAVGVGGKSVDDALAMILLCAIRARRMFIFLHRPVPAVTAFEDALAKEERKIDICPPTIGLDRLRRPRDAET